MLVLVVFLILECEPHPEDTLLRIFLTTVRHITVFVRDFLIVFREEENAVFCSFYSIANGIRLNKVHGRDQVRNLMDDADQSNLCILCFHVTALHLKLQHRHQHFLR